jgi:serine/threonine protein kinase
MSSSEDAPLLTGGVFLKDRWEVLRKIGRGGFGEIYKAKDHDTGERCAIKAESAVSSKQVLKMEVVVLKRLQSCSPHICTLLGCGRTDRINYMVMSLLGPNLSELRKQQPNQKFSLSTTLRVGVQVIAAVRAMHNCGFLHRDIKPSNFAIGASSVTKQTCYMLDYGLARQYVTPTGEIRPPRPVAGFRGTVRYASINAHQSKDLGRHDDLWSVFYLLVELANGELPWKKLRDKDKAGKFKLSFDHKRLLKHLPAEFFDFLDHLKSLDYFQEPDYVMLSTLLQNAIRYLGIKRSDLLDWEQDASVQSLTTVSVGSAPALQTNQNTAKGKAEGVGKEGEDSRTRVSTEDCMSQNGEKKERKIARKLSDENAGNRSTKIGPLVQSKRLNLLQHRRSMPPSPLLQATHLVQQNDSGLPHTNSLDRFFDMRPARSHSLSGSGNQEEKASSRDEEVDVARMANSPEEERSFSNKAHCGKHTGEDGYEQLKSESNGGAPEVIVKNESRAKNLVNGEIDGLELLDQRVGTNQVSPKSQVLHQYGAGPTEVHPDKTPPPQLGYGTEKMNGEDGERGEQSTPSDSSCFQHRLFACSVQNRGEEGQVDNAEQVPLEMIPRTRSHEVHSPGPPPLEFHQERLQTMWGHDSTRPISLSQLGQPGERSGDLERMVILPQPPDHPPPKHYTLLAARRRRFRRPAGKT